MLPAESVATAVPLRPPAVVMQPARLAALQPTRLSASRALVNRMTRDGWQVRVVAWDLDGAGRGEARFRVSTGQLEFEFLVFSNEPDPKGRSPRIIGQSWDMMGALVEAPVDEDDVGRTREELPKLYAGRAPSNTLVWCRANRSLWAFDAAVPALAAGRTREELPKLYAGRAPSNTLVWCRANRSLRAFDAAVPALAAGRQSDLAELARIGYLMRNTGLDANGTFGTRPFRSYGAEHPLRQPYQAQLLAAYLMREFSLDLAEHLAQTRSRAAVPFDPQLRRYVGLGNGSGLGLVLWVNWHPQIVARWIELRELALAHAKSLPLSPDSPQTGRLMDLLDRAITFRAEDQTVYQIFASGTQVASELAHQARHRLVEFRAHGTMDGRPRELPLAYLADQVDATAGMETAETLHALLVELVPTVADELLDRQIVESVPQADPRMTVAEFRDLLHAEYAWALHSEAETTGDDRYVWYKSRNAEEPRRGPRDEVPDGTVDFAVDLPELLPRLDRDLRGAEQDAPVGFFLLRHPQHRAWVQRIQHLRGVDYHSPAMYMRSEHFRPAEIIRLVNVAFYGLDKTCDFLNRNLRGLLFHGAPSRSDLTAGRGPHQDWFWPTRPAGVAGNSTLSAVGS
ncbi:MAG: hypothetical protein GEV07_12195 [Streptosporangiales bacterium]|nr:hypothetical protein [Streptosporangiales bacterium]